MYILFFSLNFYLYFVLDIMVHNTNKEHKSRLCFIYIPKLILHLRLNHNNSDYILLNLSQKQYAESHYNTAGSNIGRFSFTNSCTFPECSKQSENERWVRFGFLIIIITTTVINYHKHCFDAMWFKSSLPTRCGASQYKSQGVLLLVGKNPT